MNKIALAIHGGAGTILQIRNDCRARKRISKRFGKRSPQQVGKFCKKTATALDAVEAAVVELENFPLFNPGKGSVFTHEGKNEIDAAIMDGTKLKAGAVAFVKNVKNPITSGAAGDGKNRTRFARRRRRKRICP